MPEATVIVWDAISGKGVPHAEVSIEQPNGTRYTDRTREGGEVRMHPYCIEKGMAVSILAEGYVPLTVDAEKTDWRKPDPIRFLIKPIDEELNWVTITKWHGIQIPGIQGTMQFVNRDMWVEIASGDSNALRLEYGNCRCPVELEKPIQVSDVFGYETHITFHHIQHGLYASFSYTPPKPHDCGV